MIFGDPTLFAVEAMLEPGTENGPVTGNNLAGRIRCWIGGAEVGRFDEPLCWLGPPSSELVEMSARLDTLWHPSLAGLTDDEVFDRLDDLCFRAHRGERIDSDERAREALDDELNSENWLRFSFLLHSSEAFDGWKSFLLRPSAGELIALVAKDPQKVVVPHRFPVDVFTKAVHAFDAWLLGEERRLMPWLGK